VKPAFVYTPVYEGGECTGGTRLAMIRRRGNYSRRLHGSPSASEPRRWALLGNDMCGHMSQSTARSYVARCGAEVVSETTCRFTPPTFRAIGDHPLRASMQCCLSLVGEDAIAFNRAFGEQGIPGDRPCASPLRHRRDNCAGHRRTEHRAPLWRRATSRRSRPVNIAFKERYYSHFGDRALTELLGQSTYMKACISSPRAVQRGLLEPSQWSRTVENQSPTVREAIYSGDGTNLAPTYMAVAKAMPSG
jgi:hypothetical protein